MNKIIDLKQADVKNIKSFNRRDEWWLEVNFNGGAKCVTPATQDEVTQVESDLRDRGWQVDASVFHRGFNAKPVLSTVEGPNGLGRWSPRDAKRLWTMRADTLAIASLDEPLDYDDEELIFASSAGQWVDDYAIEQVRL